MEQLTMIAGYVALKFVDQFIKDEGYGRLKKFFFPKQKYRKLVAELIMQTISEYEEWFTDKEEAERYLFYKTPEFFEALNGHIFFSDTNQSLSLDELAKDPKVIVPTQEQLEFFYSIFYKKIRADKKLKKLYIEENYQEKIFHIATELKELHVIAEKTFENTEQIKSQIFQLQQRFDKDLTFISGEDIQGVSAYPKLDNASPRSNLVDSIITLFQKNSWIWVHGNISMGKTQISLAVAERFETTYLIDLKDYKPGQYLTVLIKELSFQLLADASNKDVAKLVTSMPDKALIILDDICSLDLTGKEWALFTVFIVALGKKDIKILSTSNMLPGTQAATYFNDSIFPWEIPLMTEGEVKETITAFGATEELALKLQKAILDITKGHPAIVTAACRFLKQSSWQINQDVLDGLFDGDFSKDLDEETYRRIMNTIADVGAKDLLYRLGLIRGNISIAEIDAIAGVNPEVHLLQEKLLSLTGLWVQKKRNDLFELSPLVRRIRPDLTRSVSIAASKALGFSILSKGKINQVEAKKAILYFIDAEEYNQAATTLTFILEAAFKNPDVYFEWGFEQFWSSESMPAQMHLFIQSVVRQAQVELFIRAGKDGVDFLVSDLESIVTMATNKGIDVPYASLKLAAYYSKKDSDKASHFLAIGFKQLQNYPKLADTGDFVFMEGILWHNLIFIKSLDEFDNWLGSISHLSKIRKKSTDIDNLEYVSCIIFGTKLYDKFTKDGDIVGLIETYEKIIEKCASNNLDVLANCCSKFMIRALVVRDGNTTAALAYFTKQYSKGADGVVALLLEEEMGRQLFYKDQHQQARIYLLKAVAREVPKAITEKIEALSMLSQISEDLEESYNYARLTYELQKGNEYVKELYGAKLIGELAIVAWSSGRKSEVFKLMDEGMDRLLTSYAPEVEYKGTILRYCHVLNYYFHKFSNSPLPKVEGVPYIEPFKGCYYKDNEGLASDEYYYDARKWMAAYLMVQVWEKFGDKTLANKWVSIALNIFREKPQKELAPLLTQLAFYPILESKYVEAVSLQTEIIRYTNESVHSDLTDDSSHPLFKAQFRSRPGHKIEVPDAVLFDLIVFFCIINELWKSVADPAYHFDGLNEQWIEINQNFTDQKPLSLVLRGLECLRTNDRVAEKLSSLMEEAEGFPSSVKILLYLISSMKANAKIAFKFHLAIIQSLVTLSLHMTSAPFNFLVLPFITDFWTHLIVENKEEFDEYDFLINKGLSKIEAAEGVTKVRALFEVLSHHLDEDLPFEVSEWLDNY